MRSFFALPVPEPIALKLLALVPPLKQLRRVRPANLHLTLHFLQDAPTTLPADLALTNLPSAFTLTPARLILLPESGPIKIVAASLTQASTSPLHQLHSAVAAELTRLNLPVEQRKFLPHLTLARADPPLPQQVRSQTPMQPREDLTFSANTLHLIESRPTEKGFEYVPLKTWALPQPPP